MSRGKALTDESKMSVKETERNLRIKAYREAHPKMKLKNIAKQFGLKSKQAVFAAIKSIGKEGNKETETLIEKISIGDSKV